MEEKQEFRKIYQTRRSGMSRHDVEAKSAQICAQIIGSALFGGAQYLYAYCPADGEADILLVVQAAWQKGKRVAFPQVCGEEMRFLEVKDFGQFAEGAFGIPEPVEEAGAVPVDWLEEDSGAVSADWLAEEPGTVPAEGAAPSGRAPGSRLLVLVPGVAFDRRGTRMGRGKGYYDRYFAELKKEEGITLLGVAYDCQIADRLPAGSHDLTVPYFVTEGGIILSAQSCG